MINISAEQSDSVQNTYFLSADSLPPYVQGVFFYNRLETSPLLAQHSPCCLHTDRLEYSSKPITTSSAGREHRPLGPNYYALIRDVNHGIVIVIQTDQTKQFYTAAGYRMHHNN